MQYEFQCCRLVFGLAILGVYWQCKFYLLLICGCKTLKMTLRISIAYGNHVSLWFKNYFQGIIYLTKKNIEQSHNYISFAPFNDILNVPLAHLMLQGFQPWYEILVQVSLLRSWDNVHNPFLVLMSSRTQNHFVYFASKRNLNIIAPYLQNVQNTSNTIYIKCNSNSFDWHVLFCTRYRRETIIKLLPAVSKVYAILFSP